MNSTVRPDPHSVESIAARMRAIMTSGDPANCALGFIQGAAFEVDLTSAEKVARIQNVLVAEARVRTELSEPDGRTFGSDPEAAEQDDDGGGGFAFGQDDHLPLHLSQDGAHMACGLTFESLPRGHGYASSPGHVTCRACLDELPKAE